MVVHQARIIVLGAVLVCMGACVVGVSARVRNRRSTGCVRWLSRNDFSTCSVP